MITMAITFSYFSGIDDIIPFLTELVGGSFIALVYLMVVFSSKKQPRDNRSSQILMIAGIIGISLTVLGVALPRAYCSICDLSERSIVGTYNLSITTASLIPMLLCLGVSLILVSNLNKENDGKILTASGFLWMAAFIGYIIEPLASALAQMTITNLYMWSNLSILAYLVIPAAILLIVHGAKYKNVYFVLAGTLYIISWLVALFLPWLAFSYLLPILF